MHLWFFSYRLEYNSMASQSISSQLVLAAVFGRTRFLAVLNGLYLGCQVARHRVVPSLMG